MSEVSSSKMRVFRFVTGMPDTVDSYVLASEANAEIERLTAELQMTRNEADTADRNRASAISENARLRKALEWIAPHPISHNPVAANLARIAREALGRPADETSG